MSRGLTKAQIAFYNEHGYLLLEDVIPVEDMQLLVDEFSETIDLRAREAYNKGKLSNLYADEPFETRLAKIYDSMAVEDANVLLKGVHGKEHKSAGLFKIASHPAILDIVESLIGPEILFHPQFNARAKLPEKEAMEVPWHQDIIFLDPEVENTFMVNFWIPLVDVNVENGCLEIIPDTHELGILPHQKPPAPITFPMGIPEGDVPAGARVPCILLKGGLAMIQHKTLHRSFPNRSRLVRWTLDLRYSDPSLPTGRSEVPGVIVRSQKNPELVAKSHLDWLKLFAME